MKFQAFTQLNPIRKTTFVVGAVLFLIAIIIAIALFINIIYLQDRSAQRGVIALDLAHPSDWQYSTFRFKQDGRYALYLTTVNVFQKPDMAGAAPSSLPYSGSLEVMVVNPYGQIFLHRVVAAGSTDHVKPANMAWTKLKDLEIGRPFKGEWKTYARVLKADEQFAGSRSDVRIVAYDAEAASWNIWLSILFIMILMPIAVLGLILMTFRPVIVLSFCGLLFMAVMLYFLVS